MTRTTARPRRPHGRAAADWSEEAQTVHLSTRLDHDGQGVLVRVAGELDVATAPALRAVLATAQQVLARDHRDGGPAVLRVDLAGVRFADRAGLAPLESARRTSSAGSRRLRLQTVPLTIERLLVLLDDPLLETLTRRTSDPVADGRPRGLR